MSVGAPATVAGRELIALLRDMGATPWATLERRPELIDRISAAWGHPGSLVAVFEALLDDAAGGLDDEIRAELHGIRRLCLDWFPPDAREPWDFT